MNVVTSPCPEVSLHKHVDHRLFAGLALHCGKPLDLFQYGNLCCMAICAESILEFVQEKYHSATA
jgi:hypothetical protein